MLSFATFPCCVILTCAHLHAEHNNTLNKQWINQQNSKCLKSNLLKSNHTDKIYAIKSQINLESNNVLYELTCKTS